ncbi:mitochondrial 37S ribosomal protein mS44 MRP13 [Nakaseomyces bracarensis]|uniref:mitochondrial 37S ribosomal protein mS44 MRP13 n=1 Tax=Nakaseomyces bracarensis TaxID=273131 RepID=UPI0038716DE6
MLRFRRLYSVAKSNKQLLDEFYEYYSTKKDLRPLIYRPRNATVLRSMDLKDPVTNKPLQPRDPVRPLGKQVLNGYIESLPEGSKELMDWLHKWCGVSLRKKTLFRYLSGSHLQTMLFSSLFRIGHFGHTLGLLHSYQGRIVAAGNTQAYNAEQYFNTAIACSILRNSAKGLVDSGIALKKLRVNWAKTTTREIRTGLTWPLIEAYAHQQGIDATKITLAGVEKNVPIQLPKPEEDLTNYVSRNKYLYYIARVIAEHSETCPNDITVFIQDYQKSLSSIQKQDDYESSIESMQQLLSHDKEQPEEQSEEQSEPQT